MDTRPKIEPPHVRKVLSVTFNEDKSMFAVGLEDGFMSEWLPIRHHTFRCSLIYLQPDY